MMMTGSYLLQEVRIPVNVNTCFRNASRRALFGSSVQVGQGRPAFFSLMLRDKGVGEYVAAAKLILQRWPHVECSLLGFVDVQNPAAISRVQMEAWVAKGHVSYPGVSDDVRAEIIAADCVVLPSYREGTPHTLLEAAAMGRPIIATDAVDCREVVDDGNKNGLLCTRCAMWRI